MAAPRKHVLLITFPAYGHIIPILELGRKLVKQHDVTLAVSASCIAQMKQRELVQADDGIQYLPIEDGYDITNIIDPNNFNAFIDMMKLVLVGITDTVANLPTRNKDGTFGKDGKWKPVDVVIIDNFVSKPADACVEKGIQLYHFAPASSGSLIMFLAVEESWPELPEGASVKMTGEMEPGAPPPPIPKYFKQLLLDVQLSIPKLDGVIVNSVSELETDILTMLRTNPKLGNTPIFTVGPLMPIEKEDPKNSVLKGQIADWMDAQKERSIVYVSFGSLAWPSGEQIGELVRGLLALGQPFILALRSPFHEHLPTEIRANIAHQFTAKDPKCLVIDWAPQKFILAHPSTGVFLSHTGWNSTLESLTAGIPIVAWPMFADQMVNGQFVEKRGLGIMVRGTGVTSQAERVVPAAEVAETVGKVAGFGGQETSYWKAAQDIQMIIQKALAPGGSTDNNLKQLAEFTGKH